VTTMTQLPAIIATACLAEALAFFIRQTWEQRSRSGRRLRSLKDTKVHWGRGLDTKVRAGRGTFLFLSQQYRGEE